MNHQHLCMGCMEDKGTAEICPHCGYSEGTPPSAPQHLPPGTILNGRYLLGRVLGQGGFGITYLAWDLSLETKLAIKEYMPRDCATRSAEQTMVSVYSGEARTQFDYGLEKFLDEAKILIKFNSHPGIVSVRDFFKENGTAYLVMYYLEGITFKEYLQCQGGRVPFDTALKIMIPIMDVLRELHQHNLLHRDISPDNIYITKDRQVKLLDFGAARQAIGEHSKSLSVVLKPGYAPEEQYRTKGRQGPWTDIYAVAATLYRAIAGEVPPESLDRIEEDTLMPPSRLGVAIDPRTEAALLQALSVRAADRFRSMREFQAALTGEMHTGEMPGEAGFGEMLHSTKAMTHGTNRDPEAHVPEQTSGYGRSDYGRGEQEPQQPKPPVPAWIWWTGGGAAAFVVIIFAVVLMMINSTVTVPNVIGKTLNEAQDDIYKNKLEVRVYDENSDTVPAGSIIDQVPKVGAKLKKNEMVALYQSKGPESKLGYRKITEGTIQGVPTYAEVADFAGEYFTERSFDWRNNVKRLILGFPDQNQSKISTYQWSANGLTLADSIKVPGPIYDITADKSHGHLWVTGDNKVFIINYENGQLKQNSKDLSFKLLGVRFGKLNESQPSLLSISENADGSRVLYSTGFKPIPLDKFDRNIYLADVIGNGKDQLLKMNKKNGQAWIFTLYWNGTTFLGLEDGNFGGQLINFYPGDIDGDGKMKLITIHEDAQGTKTKLKIWKYDISNYKYSLVDSFTVQSCEAVLVGDFKGDGKPDILTLRTDKNITTYALYSKK